MALRRKYMLVSVMALTVAAVGWGYYTWSQASFDPSDLRRPWWYYAWVLPDLARYYLARAGTSGDEVEERFGPPDEVYEMPNAALEERVNARAALGWSQPPATAARRVRVYWVRSASTAAIVYFSFNESDSLVTTFVSED